jgi:hypothetical protein
MCKSTFLLPLSKPVRNKNRESTPAGGSGGPRFRRLGRLEPWPDGGKEGGVVGNSETCSPWRGGDGRVAAGGVQRRPAAVSRGGGAPVCFRPWEGAEDAQLDGLDLLVVPARLEGQWQRQNVGGGGELGNGRQRCGSTGAAAARHCRARRGSRVRGRGTSARP